MKKSGLRIKITETSISNVSKTFITMGVNKLILNKNVDLKRGGAQGCSQQAFYPSESHIRVFYVLCLRAYYSSFSNM